MKKKINGNFILLTMVAIIVTILLSTFISYTVLKSEVMEDLESYAHALKETNTFNDTENIDYNPNVKNLRITVVREDGSVAFDTIADAEHMENHLKREEIKDAFANGTGKSIRNSHTIGKSSFYYAIKLDTGAVLRVSKEASSMTSVFMSSLPVILVVAICLIALCIIFSHILTKSIISPIEELATDLENKDIHNVYKELRPFVSMIQKQHNDIIKTSQLRQEFTANVSHELKTPLTAISGYAELMENGMATDEDMVRFSGEIHRNAKRLLTLINDIIRLSELDSSAIEDTCEDIDLYVLADNCVSMLTVNAEKHDVSIDLSGEHTHINANKEMINELIYNLCDNAIRYNNKGGSVFVTVGKEKDGKAFLEVKDTGIGISESNQKRIFERFYRVDKSRSKSTGGTGLGLAIVKHIVSQSHAVLQLDSELGKGTTIRVIFNN